MSLHPRHRARNYTHSAMIQLLKAEHKLDLALTTPKRHLDAALLHLELARQYANDAETAIRGYLHDRSGTLPPVPPPTRHDG